MVPFRNFQREAKRRHFVAMIFLEARTWGRWGERLKFGQEKTRLEERGRDFLSFFGVAKACFSAWPRLFFRRGQGTCLTFGLVANFWTGLGEAFRSPTRKKLTGF